MHTLHQGDEKFVGGETLGPSGGGGGRQEKALEVFPGILGAGLSRAGPSGISRHLCSAQYTCKCADVAPSFQQRRVSTATERQSGQVRSRSSHRQRHSSQNTCCGGDSGRNECDPELGGSSKLTRPPTPSRRGDHGPTMSKIEMPVAGVLAGRQRWGLGKQPCESSSFCGRVGLPGGLAHLISMCKGPEARMRG